MMDNATDEFLKALGAQITPCGSRVTCYPPPTDTDEDFLVFVPPDFIPEIMTGLNSCGYSWEGGGEHYQNQAQDGFMSFRNGSINLIVSSNEDFIEKHKVATYVCTRLNLMKKPDRIMIFQAVLYGKVWSK